MVKIKLRKKGMVGVGFVVFLFVFFVVMMLSIEVYNVYNYKDYAVDEMTRACSIAMDLSMLDSARITHDGEIDTVKAKEELSNYFEDVLGYTALDATGMKWGKNEDGVWKYKFELSDIDITAKPPQIYVEGVIKIPPSVLGPFLESWGRSDLCVISIPFRAQSRNSENLLF